MYIDHPVPGASVISDAQLRRDGAGGEGRAAASAGQGLAPRAASASWAIASFSYRNSTGLPAAIATAVLSADRGPSAVATVMPGLARRIAAAIRPVISPAARPRLSSSS